MNLKQKAATGVFVLAGIFGGSAYGQSQGKDVQPQSKELLAFNDNANPESKPLAAPMIRTGHAGEAQGFSIDNNALVIFVSGGEYNEKYTAEQYANMLAKMFKDPARTSHPTNVAVYYDESGKNRSTAAVVYSNGLAIDWDGGSFTNGDQVIHPYDLVGEIDEVTKDHAVKNGLAVVPSSTQSNAATLAQN